MSGPGAGRPCSIPAGISKDSSARKNPMLGSTAHGSRSTSTVLGWRPGSVGCFSYSPDADQGRGAARLSPKKGKKGDSSLNSRAAIRYPVRREGRTKRSTPTNPGVPAGSHRSIGFGRGNEWEPYPSAPRHGALADPDLDAVGERVGDEAVAMGAIVHLLELRRVDREAVGPRDALGCRSARTVVSDQPKLSSISAAPDITATAAHRRRLSISTLDLCPDVRDTAH